MSFLFSFLHQVGDRVPSIELYEDSPSNKINIQELCEGKKVVLFAVPGAFTPGCSKVSIAMYYIHLFTTTPINIISVL